MQALVHLIWNMDFVRYMSGWSLAEEGNDYRMFPSNVFCKRCALEHSDDNLRRPGKGLCYVS